MAEQQQTYRDKKSSRTYTAKTFKLLYDPSETFYVGALHFKGTVMNTLEVGHWAPGMWWKDTETGSKYEVQGNEEWHLLQSCLGEDCKVTPERQRLVRSYGKRQPPRGGRKGEE